MSTGSTSGKGSLAPASTERSRGSMCAIKSRERPRCLETTSTKFSIKRKEALEKKIRKWGMAKEEEEQSRARKKGD